MIRCLVMLKVGCQWVWITGGAAAGLTAAGRPAAVVALAGRRRAGNGRRQRGCRALPGGAGGTGRGLPRAARSKGGTGQGKRQRDRAADGRRPGSPAAAVARTGRRGLSACTRRAAAGRTEEREGRAAQGRHGAKGGANAGRLHRAELGKRKAPHGAGLVTGLTGGASCRQIPGRRHRRIFLHANKRR